MNDIKICVIGGDGRMAAAANALSCKGFKVFVFGLTGDMDKCIICDKLSEAVKSSQVILLPLPCTHDGVRLFAPLSQEDIILDRLLSLTTKDQYVIGGKMSEELVNSFHEKGCKTYDYYTSERLTVLNAIPTAEGAVAIAINETKSTVFGSKCAVAGYGRIGKILANLLKNMGADVTVFARSEDALTWATANGHKAVDFASAYKHVSDTDIIFNTVPSKVIDKKIIDNTKKQTLIIDLSSAPGGVDAEYAKKCGRKVIFALSLPGKIAPDTSGRIISDCVLSSFKGVFL